MSARFGAVVELADLLKTNGIFYRVKVTNKGTLEGGVSVLAVMTTKVHDGTPYKVDTCIKLIRIYSMC